MVKLSFIIPVYNVAPYLRKCVESLIHQDLHDYEIILVDDGSTDGASQICDEYVHAFEIGDLKLEIKCIHQSNAGVGAARNAGLKVAKGEYVCFVDSDDYWEPNVLGTLMAQVEREQLDVLRFDYRNVRVADVKHLDTACIDTEHTDATHYEYEVFEPNKYPHKVDSCTDVVTGERYLEERTGYACYAVMYIVKRSLLIGNWRLDIGDLTSGNCLFTEGIHFEDTEWLPRMMLRAKRVNSTPLMVYNYFLHDGSITQVQGESEKIRQNIEDSMTVINRYNAYIAQYPNCFWLCNMRSSIVVSVLSMVTQYLYASRKEYIARLKSMNVFPLSLANQGHTYLRKARLINFSPRLTTALLHLKNAK